MRQNKHSGVGSYEQTNQKKLTKQTYQKARTQINKLFDIKIIFEITSFIKNSLK